MIDENVERIEKLKKVSITDLETFFDDPRMFYYTKVMKLSYPQSPSAFLGSTVHTCIENTIAKGWESKDWAVYFMERNIKTNSKVYWDAWNEVKRYVSFPVISQEETVQYLTSSGITLRGRIDCVDGLNSVWDWKTGWIENKKTFQIVFYGIAKQSISINLASINDCPKVYHFKIEDSDVEKLNNATLSYSKFLEIISDIPFEFWKQTFFANYNYKYCSNKCFFWEDCCGKSKY